MVFELFSVIADIFHACEKMPENIDIMLGNLVAALYIPLSPKLIIPEIMKLLDALIIHHITEVGIIGRQKRSIDFIRSQSRWNSVK